MWAWLQRERKDASILPAPFRSIGKVVTLNTHRVEQAKKHQGFMKKLGMKARSCAQFARNLMYSLALTETQGNLQKAAELLRVSPGNISDARQAMQLGREFHDKPNEKFEDFDVAAMSPMPEYRYYGGPDNTFNRYTKFYPEMVLRVRHLFGDKLTDTAVFLLIDLTHRSRRDESVNWAFHIFSDPKNWVEKTGLSKSAFYRALKQLRRAGFLFRNTAEHWVIAYRGPNFKWLAREGFIFEPALGAARVNLVPEFLHDTACEAFEYHLEACQYVPLEMQTRVKDYFAYVFRSVRCFLKSLRDVSVAVFKSTARLRRYVGLDPDRERGTPRSGPDPGYAAAASTVST